MKQFLFAIVFIGAMLSAACAPRTDSPTAFPTSRQPTVSLPADLSPVPGNPAASRGVTQSVAGLGGKQYETTLGKPAVLHVRDSAVVTDSPDQFTVYFWGVSRDSRCPKTVQCFVAGDVTVDIVFQESGLMHPPVISLVYPTQPTKQIENYTVTVTDVQPARETTDAIPQSDYTATFVITQNTIPPTATISPSPPATVAPPNGLPTVNLDEPFTTRVHQTQWLPEAQLQLTVNSVLEDSRCPHSVNCVQAGRALLGLSLDQASHLGYFGLSTMPPDAETIAYFRGYTVKLLEVSPYPQNPNETIPVKDYAVKLVVSKQDPPTVVHKNEPIVLKPGQSAALADEDVTLTFVRVQSDSRCPYPASCALRGNAPVEITLRVGGDTSTYILDTDRDIAKQRSQAFGNVTVELLALNPYPRVDIANQDIAPEEYEGTFVVRKFATAPAPTSPKTPAANACQGWTANDAEMILGRPVQSAPSAHVKIQVPPADENSYADAEGICGFVSPEADARVQLSPSDPRLDAPGAAVLYAITAERLQGARVLELLRVMDIARSAVPNADKTLPLLLRAQLSAGDFAGALDTFEQAAQGSGTVQSERLKNLGKDALWLWRPGQADSYTAVIVETLDGYILAEGLVPKTLTREGLMESLPTFLSKLRP